MKYEINKFEVVQPDIFNEGTLYWYFYSMIISETMERYWYTKKN